MNTQADPFASAAGAKVCRRPIFDCSPAVLKYDAITFGRMNSFRNHRLRDFAVPMSTNWRLTDIEHACPGVGREWIRSLLTDLKAAGEVSCQGKGPAARWRYLGSKGIKKGGNSNPMKFPPPL